MKVLKLLNSLITALAGAVLAFMTVMVILQVFFRYVLKWPFPESQELAVYAMVYVVMFGGTIAVYKKSHIAVSLLVDALPARFALVVRVCAYAAMLVFFFLLVKEGWALTQRSMWQMSPSTGIPVGYIVASIPVSSAICILYVLDQMVGEVRAALFAPKEQPQAKAAEPSKEG